MYTIVYYRIADSPLEPRRSTLDGSGPRSGNDERHGYQQRALCESAIADQLEHTVMRSAQQPFCDAVGERVALWRLRAGARRVRLDDHVDVPEQRVVVHRIHLGW